MALIWIMFIVQLLSVHGAHSLAITSSQQPISSTIEEDYLAWIERIAAMSKLVNTSRPFENEAPVARLILVDKQRGEGNFQTIQDAVDSVPTNNRQRIIIQIAAGVYKEKIYIPKNKPLVTFRGAGMDLTKISWNDTAKSSNGTFRSATVTVMARNFIARDLAFENSAPAPPPGAVGDQAVALQVSGDKSAFYNCAFYGAQDTLYDHKGRHYFQNCTIVGSIDFIFGDGRSLYEGCRLQTINTSAGSLTAQKRKKLTEDTGFSFMNCTISGAGIVYLGRAWGAYSRVVYVYTYMAEVILPGGWYNWGIPVREMTVFYGQYKCFGPGANSRNRVAWSHDLTEAQAAPFMSMSFIDGQSWVLIT